MWILLVITVINGGESPSRFETAKYATQTQCQQAQRRAERNPASFGYCTCQDEKSQRLMV